MALYSEIVEAKSTRRDSPWEDPRQITAETFLKAARVPRATAYERDNSPLCTARQLLGEKQFSEVCSPLATNGTEIIRSLTGSISARILNAENSNGRRKEP
jgi:hypothetical protein